MASTAVYQLFLQDWPCDLTTEYMERTSILMSSPRPGAFRHQLSPEPELHLLTLWSELG